MASVLRRMTVAFATLLLCNIGALAAAAAPVRGAFTGTYEATYRVTNLKNGNSYRYVLSPRSVCSSPCRSVSFRVRLVSEKAWRSGFLKFHWNGGAYTTAPARKVRAADCYAKSGEKGTKGYDIISTQSFRIAVVSNGRVARFRGEAKDVYVPNATGRKAGCYRGIYDYAITGVAH
jgi:hypothetical protein